MHIDTLSGPEQRVLGCLIEKRFTTPDQYPLTLNALRLACNQSTNRDPVVNYDEETVREAAQRMARYGLTRLASGHSSRAVKYRHLADETLALGSEQLAVLAVLLLRGAQTPGELKARTERMVTWNSLAEVDVVLDQLIERDYVARLDRRPGQKEERFEPILGGIGESASAAERAAPTAGRPQGPAGAGEGLGVHEGGLAHEGGGDQRDGGDHEDRGELLARLEALEARFEQLAEAVDELLRR